MTDAAKTVSGTQIKFDRATLQADSLEFVPVEVCIDDDWLEDFWSPLWLAMELEDSAAFGAGLATYASSSVWCTASPLTEGVTIVARSEDNADALASMASCFEAAAFDEKRRGFLQAGLESLPSEQRALVPVVVCPSAFSSPDAELEGLHALLSLRSDLGLRAVIEVDTSEFSPASPVGLLPTQTHVLAAVMSATGLAPSTAPVSLRGDLANGDEAGGVFAVHVGDLVAVGELLRGGGASDLASIPVQSTPAVAYALAEFCRLGKLSDALLVSALDWLQVCEKARPWVSAPAPASNESNHQNLVLSVSPKPAASRAEVIVSLLGLSETGAAALSAENAAAWRAWFVRVAVDAFGENWTAPLFDEEVDVADEVQFGLEESRAGIARAVDKLSPKEGVADGASLSLDQRFKAAVDGFGSVAGRHPNEVKLKFYGLYKQATVGDVTGSRPWALDVAGRAKYDAWATRKGMPSDDAKAEYVAAFAAL